IGQVSEEIRPMLPAGIALDVKVPETPELISADRAQLSQVLVNLALNARDAMHRTGGTLTVGVLPTQEHEGGRPFLHFTVTDTGEGIAGRDLPHIFEPLFTTKKSGTGLGLSVVFQIVAAHGGHISVDSEPGTGSTFHLFIPAVAEQASLAEPEEEPQPEPPQKVRVLLVEDDEAIACGVQWSLEAEGLDVQTVDRGADVASAVASFRPDVMVLDLNLPDEDGRDVYERVAADSPLPVIFCSGHAFEDEIESLLGNPFTAFLMKPYSIAQLLQTIRQLTDPMVAV
ncbi:MAG TPA: ATP-binding protein, partial [Thermoanaerobaculia bacterium]|nr:ATP-binding protein [Thermoanaerobaculia bacterium]